MITPTNHSVETKCLEQAVNQFDFKDFKMSINQPTGDFFYDPWVIKPEFKETIWEKILNSLPEKQGEARIITLTPGTSYLCHADVDDRWHLNLQSEQGYLCDLERRKIYLLRTDGIWYSMDAGGLHTACNFGSKDRIQLVVRQLLQRNALKDSITVSITLKDKVIDYRYQFDQHISPWLNRANKNKIISEFVFLETEVRFSLEREFFSELEKIVPKIFEITS